jgi:hypothetical protein
MHDLIVGTDADHDDLCALWSALHSALGPATHAHDLVHGNGYLRLAHHGLYGVDANTSRRGPSRDRVPIRVPRRVCVCMDANAGLVPMRGACVQQPGEGPGAARIYEQRSWLLQYMCVRWPLSLDVC